MLRGVSTAPVLTAADVERMSIPGKQVELVRGQLVVREPPGTWHGAVAANLAYLLGEFVRRHGLGLVFAQDTGFKIGSDPDTVRAPDVAFVGRERAGVIRERGYAELAPDLLAEVLSPDDRPAEVLAKWPTGLLPARGSSGSSILSDGRRGSTARMGVSRFSETTMRSTARTCCRGSAAGWATSSGSW